MNQPKILIAIADPAIRNLLFRFFKQQNYQMAIAENKHQTIEAVNSFQPNLVILDATFTETNTIDLGQLIKQSGGKILEIVDRTKPVDRSIEFSIASDDSITKPFSLGIMADRVSSLLHPRPLQPDEIVIAGKHRWINGYGASLNPKWREVSLQREIVPLTAFEFDLLYLLFREPNRVWSRAELLQAIGGDEFDRDESVIDVWLGQIQEKFDLIANDFNDFDDLWDFGDGTILSPRPWNPKPQPKSDGETTFPDP